MRQILPIFRHPPPAKVYGQPLNCKVMHMFLALTTICIIHSRWFNTDGVIMCNTTCHMLQNTRFTLPPCLQRGKVVIHAFVSAILIDQIHTKRRVHYNYSQGTRHVLTNQVGYKDI